MQQSSREALNALIQRYCDGVNPDDVFPYVHAGTPLIIEKTNGGLLAAGDYLIAFRDGTFDVLRLQALPGRRVYCRPKDERTPPFYQEVDADYRIDNDEMKVVGRVVLEFSPSA